MQSFYVKNKVLSDRAKNYIIREMIKMTERELSTVPYDEFNKSDYRWIIGENVASAVFTNHPTRILDFDVEYKSSQIFDPNGIDFIKRPEIKEVVCHLYQDTKRLVGDIQNGYFYVDAETAYKIEESKRRAKEMDVLDDFDPNCTSKCIKDSIEKINEGDFRIAPFKEKSQYSPCRFCQNKDICLFKDGDINETNS